MSSCIARQCLLKARSLLRLVRPAISEQLALEYPMLRFTASTCHHIATRYHHIAQSYCHIATNCNHSASWRYHISQNLSIARYLTLPNQAGDAGEVAREQVKPDDTRSSTEVLAGLAGDELKRLKVLRLEYDVFYSTGVKVPDLVCDDNWLHLLRSCPTLHARKRHYHYLFNKEKAIQNEKKKHALNTQLRVEKYRRRLEEIQAEGPDALPFKNALFMQVRESTMNQHYYNNLCHAMLHGPHLVFDFGYEERMTGHELSNLFDQVQLCHGINKIRRHPFHFHFCNVRPGGVTASKLQVAFGNISTIPISVTSQHCAECYEPDRLVYLSPNAPVVMGDRFDVDDVFIIGAIVDRAVEEPLTLAKAKQEKRRMVRLPLDKHIRWVQGSKSLALNHVVSILHDFKECADWKKALLANLPSRKFTSYE